MIKTIHLSTYTWSVSDTVLVQIFEGRIFRMSQIQDFHVFIFEEGPHQIISWISLPFFTK